MSEKLKKNEKFVTSPINNGYVKIVHHAFTWRTHTKAVLYGSIPLFIAFGFWKLTQRSADNFKDQVSQQGLIRKKKKEISKTKGKEQIEMEHTMQQAIALSIQRTVERAGGKVIDDFPNGKK